MSVILETHTKRKEFSPVDDEYQPFKLVKRRLFMQENFEVPLVVKLLKLKQNQRILEVGCGPGSSLFPLARYCKPKRLVGIDVDDDLLQKAKTRLSAAHVRAELYQEDVRKMRFSNESFNIVIDFGTCYHIGHRVKALKEISRVLTKGGVFVFETPFNQLLSHPIRSWHKKLPWKMVPNLVSCRRAMMWASRMKQ